MTETESFVKARAKLRRIHITIPAQLLEQIDANVDQGNRSQFIVETVELELHRRRILAALEEMDGALADADIPDWETPESAAAWVRALGRGESLPGFSIAFDGCTS